MTEIDAFILVGGRSSRFGADKALARLAGMTLAERAVAAVRDGLPGQRVTMVAGNSTQFAIDAIVTDVPFVFDLVENRGPLGGLHAALAYARTPWIFFVACDYPFLSSDLIQLLAGKISSEFGAIVPVQEDGRGQPLCAFYDVAVARPVVEEILRRSRVSPPMHEVVAGLRPQLVGFDEYRDLTSSVDVFFNVNTRDDLESAELIDGSKRAK